MILLMIMFLFAGLLAGLPVAIHLAATGLLFSLIGIQYNYFDAIFLQAIPNRLFGIVNNQLLISVPLFVLMGNILEKTNIAERLLNVMAQLLGRVRGGLGLSVLFVGMLMAASTGIVGATVVTMTLIALPSLIKHEYSQELATGTIASAGTLGQLIPPSIALILLADVLGNAYQQAQLEQGKFFLETVSVADLFSAAIFPGLLLVCLYGAYIVYASESLKQHSTEHKPTIKKVVIALFPPLCLIIMVLGSILLGIATPTEAASLGSLGAFLIAYTQRKLNFSVLQNILEETQFVTCMVFFILMGASLFSLAFRGLGGDHALEQLLQHIPGGINAQLICVLGIIFLLGFMLDFIEIIFIVIPIIAPILFKQGIDPLWFGILVAINLQTSFLTPPFGFALFYMRGTASDDIKTKSIYKGIVPFIMIQLVAMSIIFFYPPIATGLANSA